jgi:hypothetical protein
MTELDRALADITAMRRQLSHATLFRGFGPAALAMTGAVAALGGVMQGILIPDPVRDVASYLVLWTLVATAAVVIIGLEAVRRASQEHGGLADDMLKAAARQFLPAGLAGVLLTGVIVTRAPEVIWMLPGLWQIILSLGVAAAAASLPRPMIVVCLWYLACGLACLVVATRGDVLSPWAMAAPFAIGQALSALLLKYSFGGGDDEAG